MQTKISLLPAESKKKTSLSDYIYCLFCKSQLMEKPHNSTLNGLVAESDTAYGAVFW